MALFRYGVIAELLRLPPGPPERAGGFRLPPTRAAPAPVLLVESALDALSVHQCPPPGLPAATLIASTAGLTATWPPWLDPRSALPLLCGYDADPAGDRAATALQRQCPATDPAEPRIGTHSSNVPASPSPPPTALRSSIPPLSPAVAE